MDPRGTEVLFYEDVGHTNPEYGVIAYVHNNGKVNLSVLSKGGMWRGELNVTMIEPGDELPTNFYCVPLKRNRPVGRPKKEAALA